MSILHHAAVTAALTVIPLLAALGSGAFEADASLLELTSSVRLAQAGPSENPQTLGDPNGPVPVQVAGPVAGTKASRTNSRGVAASAAARVARLPTPKVSLPAALDARPTYAGQTSCDPYAKPGARAYAELMRQTFGQGGYGIERTCAAGGTSEHKEGRAIDWMLNANDPGQKAVADAATLWLTSNDGQNARRLGVLYIIWNRKMWRAYAPERGWQPYVGESPHTDHIHTSLTWDGAMGRTSWWTGAAVGRNDVGPCRVYRGEFAPLYTGPQFQQCATALPVAPYSPFPLYVVGQKATNIAVAQRALGVNADGAFGAATRNALLSWQSTNRVPRTGVLDKSTWVALVPNPPPASHPVTPPSNPTTKPASRPTVPLPVSSGAGSPVVNLPPAPTRVLALPKSVTNRFTPLKGLVLRPGSTGAPVRVLQRALGLRVDAKFTILTTRAVRNVQRAHRLPMTGVTDRKTWNRIELRAFPWFGYAAKSLAQGSRGPAVVALQRAVRVTPDGEFGTNTARAVLLIQRRYGLAPDGIVRGATWRAVFAQGPR